jgi:hypothetical protein
MNDNTTPQAEIDARARWEAEKEKADSPLDATCPACGGSGLGPAMYRPEIDKTQRDRCYTCKGTGTKPPTSPTTLDDLCEYLTEKSKEHKTLASLTGHSTTGDAMAGHQKEWADTLDRWIAEIRELRPNTFPPISTVPKAGCLHPKPRDIGDSSEGMGHIIIHWCPDCGAIKRTMTNWKCTDYPWEIPGQSNDLPA